MQGKLEAPSKRLDVKSIVKFGANAVKSVIDITAGIITIVSLIKSLLEG